MPPPDFHASKLKIERAKKHILDLNALLTNFLASDFYSVTVEKESQYGLSLLKIDFDETQFPSDGAALIIGDALHNLKSALDLLYFQVVSHGGVTTKYTMFPIRNTRQELIGPLKNALETHQISSAVHDFILDTVKPYKAGNYPLWAVHDLNVWDKHQLLIPVLKLMRFVGIRLETNEHTPVNEGSIYYLDSPCYITLPDDRPITLKDKGHAAGNILFGLGLAYEGSPIIRSLNGIAEEITRTVEAFDILGMSGSI